MGEKIENRGGPRPGSGRPIGTVLPATLEKQRVLKILQQKIMAKAGRLLRAMFAAAEGENYLFKEVKEMKERKDGSEYESTKKVMVTEPKEIEMFLDEHVDGELEGSEGTLVNESKEEVYYYIKTKPCDWKAIESLFDRVFGKAKQSIELDGGININNTYEQLSDEQLGRQIEDLRIAIGAATTTRGDEEEKSNDSGDGKPGRTEEGTEESD